MGIKYLKGIYGDTKPKTTRPKGLDFPLGLSTISSVATANSANTTTLETFDILVVAGGGAGGNKNQQLTGPPEFNPFGPAYQSGGGGGAGGVRVFSANNFNQIPEFKNSVFTTQSTNFIPITVGGAGGNTLVATFLENCRGGQGGCGGGSHPQTGTLPRCNGLPGGSGGGGGQPGSNPGSDGLGIAGQGTNGVTAGGSALTPDCSSGGLTTSITGSSIRFGDGGAAGSASVGTANRGNGGGGAAPVRAPLSGGSGGSGIVAIRYRNPTAPTTPLATGGNCVCCTGGCIIHIFESSGFLNLTSNFDVN